MRPIKTMKKAKILGLTFIVSIDKLPKTAKTDISSKLHLIHEHSICVFYVFIVSIVGIPLI